MDVKFHYENMKEKEYQRPECRRRDKMDVQEVGIESINPSDKLL